MAVEMAGRPPGWPGIEPRWSGGDKQAVGAALGAASRVWFTVGQGILTEVYYPSPDVANTRDLQCLVTGPDGLFLESRRDLTPEVAPLEHHVPAYAVTLRDPGGRIVLRQRIVPANDADALLWSIDLEVLRGDAGQYRLFVLLAPHVANQGYGNFAEAAAAHGRQALLAWRAGYWLSLMAKPDLKDPTCTYSGPEDAYWDIRSHGRITRRYREAPDGNLALAAEIPDAGRRTAHLALGFGHGRASACFAAHRVLVAGEAVVRAAFSVPWRAYLDGLEDLAPYSLDGGHLLHASARVLRTHMDKRVPGAVIASLSIPWGYACGDQNVGGYHLIWTRDLYEAATGFLALGDAASARQCLLYMASTQRPDGGWPQNNWLDGTPYWPGCQLDEVAFPVVLAYRLEQVDGLGGFDPWPMCRRALGYLLRQGPETPQDRWEEDSGYSPSTMAAELSALLVGAAMAEGRGEGDLATLLRETADAWFALLERYACVRKEGVADGRPYYVRIAPLVSGDSSGGVVAAGYVPVKNLPPDVPHDYPLGEVIDGGFLELVRFGVKRADDPVVVTSVELCDRLLRVRTPNGDLWHRYTHDGYGEHADGSAYDGSGIGRAWPLLAGERGHYELALGGTADEAVRTMERVAGASGLLPEQVWDAPDIPARRLYFGEATGSARPLVWAHAEYVKLLRSRRDGRVFDRLEPVAAHFAHPPKVAPPRLWAFNQKVRRMAARSRLRLWLTAAATVRYSTDGWATATDLTTRDTGLGVHVADLPTQHLADGATVRFTFHWSEADRWEGQDFAVDVVAGAEDA